MTSETREKIDRASADWDAANGECHRLLGMIAATDISSQDFDRLLNTFCEAQARRRAAGDRHMAAISQGWIEDAPMLAFLQRGGAL